MKIWKYIDKVIDLATEFMGWLGWILILYCMIFGITGVFLRYVLNAPSLWIGTTIQAAVVLMACMGGAYAFKHGFFIRVDLFYAQFSPRGKALCDILLVSYTFLYLGVLIWKGITMTQISIMLDQHTPTAVPLPIYPIKAIIPVAASFVLLLVIRKLIHDIRMLAVGESDSAVTSPFEKP